ncbi:hypothetical protein FQA47_016100 [Oryzias melastigma]|uniref:Uncharacterized protein n=1 Tax=Oryzias melastigma TaxID=30732 RepID=A0A834L0P0_ORYME|nr:hypothetical protein FQA47_016100 [Oryzias melastigma]
MQISKPGQNSDPAEVRAATCKPGAPPAGNTLCKSGSIAVFGNVVYSGLLNDHLWHLGVPLFTRLEAVWAPVGFAWCSSEFRVMEEERQRCDGKTLG